MENEGIANPYGDSHSPFDVDHDHDCNEGNRSSTKSQVSVGKRRQLIGFLLQEQLPAGAQPSIKSAVVEKVKMVLARWWYDANITIQCSSI
jgi:hypothetical protein